MDTWRGEGRPEGRFHYIYGGQKNDGAARGLRKFGYQIQHRGRSLLVQAKRGKRGGRVRGPALTKYRCLPRMTMFRDRMFPEEGILGVFE